MSFLRRKMTIQLQLVGDTFDGGGDSLQLENLRVPRCSIKATQGGATSFQGQLQMRIEGMLGSDMAKLSTLGLTSGIYTRNNLAVYAGDDASGMSLVFNGQIFAAWVDYNAMPEVGIEISASQTAQLQQAPIAASSFRGSMNVATMLQGIAASAGLTFVNAGVTAVLANHAVGGSAARQIADICQAALVNYDIHDKTLTIWPQGGSRDNSVISVSPTTGLVGYPMYSAQGIDIVTEFNPDILLGRQVSVSSTIPPPGPNSPLNPAGVPTIGASGTFWAFDVTHDISCEMPDGAWYTRVKLGTVNTQARMT